MSATVARHKPAEKATEKHLGRRLA
jgi:hypothetical protein